MKSIDDYLDDIEDVLSQEGECEHSSDWDEGRQWDTAEYSLTERGRLEIQEILVQMRQADYDRVIEIVSKVADERYERERDVTGKNT